ncbi:AraC family transcriptional regulator ligand-binding domain-containing protein [Paraglaciecola sp.]|uniref:AraC family transcriptional regulator n=1 Tax=Paraglaciecola sp. TaxID=1920173 RepID=UPI003266E5CF
MKLKKTRTINIEDKLLPAHQYAASLFDLVTSRNVNKHKLLRGTRIFQEDFKSDKLLSPQQLLQLTHNANALTPGNDCSFQLGRRLFPGNYGAVSNALMYSKNLGEALRLLSILRNQICPFLEGNAYSSEDKQYLLIKDSFGDPALLQFFIEVYCAALVSTSKLLFERRIPFSFGFPFKRPKHIQEYEENLGYKLAFSQPIFSISFDRKWLHTKCTHRSDGLKWYSLKQAKMSSIPKLGFLEQVRKLLMKNRQLSLKQAAAVFSMSPATFKRKLSLHGKSFQQIQDELGKQYATYLLQMQHLSNEESASLMQFNDIPNFRRAVKRWTGQTPSQLRLT